MSTPGQVGRPSVLGRMSAAIYDKVNGSMERRIFGERRRHLLEAALGRVLDVGAGTGANLPHYLRDRVTELVLLDVSRGMLPRARRRASEMSWEVTLQEASAEDLPFGSDSFDTVVFTLSLCTIPDPTGALLEAHRVLKSHGTLLALEHVRAHELRLARRQDRLAPFWKVIGSGCHLNRDTRRSIEVAGFVFESVEEKLETRIPLSIIQPQLLAVARKPG